MADTTTTATETPQFQLAAVFDLVDPVGGPGFTDDHEVIQDLDRLDLLVERLNAGTAVLMTPTLMDDVIDPSRTAVVPMNFRTDGSWIWTDTITYYLEQYGLAPEAGLLAHLEEGDGTPWTPDQQTMEQAVDFILTPPPADEPIWKLG
ncbi:hypothetical protein AB0K51_30890 [Kitasatospora sp. NPDC049285]|uniref:hypothetical protein n=1 Tax=Kitasatospora sp. NPDC049285 TaxID=3157096 RepID=UPI003431702C